MKISIDDQIKNINRILNRENECKRCGMRGIFMYCLNGEPLCPHCDHDIIEDYKLEHYERV